MNEEFNNNNDDNNHHSLRLLLIVIVSIAVASGVIIIIVAITDTAPTIIPLLFIPTKDYDVRVDPIVSNQGGGFYSNNGPITTVKVLLTNTGKLPLTNITAKYIEAFQCKQNVSLQLSDKERSSLIDSIQSPLNGRIDAFIEKYHNQIDGVTAPETNMSDISFFKYVQKQQVIGEESIKAIQPGEKSFLSPSGDGEGISTNYVSIVADHGINVTSTIKGVGNDGSANERLDGDPVCS